MNGKLTQGKAAQVSRYLPLGIRPRFAAMRGVPWLLGARPAPPSRQGRPAGLPLCSAQRRRIPHCRTGAGRHPGQRAAGVGSGSGLARIQPGDGELLFERSAMQIRNARGRLWGVALNNVQGGIRNLAEHAVLELEGHAPGRPLTLYAMSGSSPVGGWLMVRRPALNHGRGPGRAATDAAPATGSPGPVHRQGSCAAGRRRPAAASRRAAAGQRAGAWISRTKASNSAGTARVYGGEAQLEGGSQPDGSLRLTAAGAATATACVAPLTWVWRPAGPPVQGQAPYRVQLGIVRGYTELLVTSPTHRPGHRPAVALAEVRRSQPALRVQFSPVLEAHNSAKPQRDVLRVDLGSVLSAQYQRDVSGDAARVLRGALAVNAPLPEMAPGVRAVLNLQQVHADAWSAVADGVGPRSGSGEPTGGRGPAKRSGSRARCRGCGHGHIGLPAAVGRAQGAGADTGVASPHQPCTELRRVAAPAPGWHAQVEAVNAVRFPTRNRVGPTTAGARAGAVGALVGAAVRRRGRREPARQGARQRARGPPGGGRLRTARPQAGQAHGGRGESQPQWNRLRREWRLNRLALALPEGELVATGQWARPGAMCAAAWT